MKNRILSLILGIAILLSMIILTVSAESTVEEAKCPHCNTALSEITWTAWNATTAKATSGHYYLESAVKTANQFVPAAADVVIDLRGCSYSITKANTRAFLINDGITLSIIDSVGTGTISGTRTSKGSAFCVQGGGVLNLYGGTAVAGYNATSGSVAYVETDGILNIYGTAVLDGSAVTDGSGTRGTVYSNGTVNMSGGEIKGASAGSGGSIYVEAGNLTISGGKISGGQAANYGDDIFVNNPESVVTISGGEVSGQFQISVAGSVTVSGAPKLSNLKLSSSVLLTLDQLMPDAQIAVAGEGIFTIANPDAKTYLEAGYFTCLTTGKAIREENEVLIID